ncbi:MAG TPA: molybdenum ABC transporter ATP-binding protein, partial [Geobacteraceae bacterium]|nr:molybdenum ABC transporter ATP-binding protein [Geobacteraceae bacterium]
MEMRVKAGKSYGAIAMDFDFAVSGERVGVFGESGSGKSTLVGMLAGLLQPDRGEITLDGESLFSSERGINIPPERRRIAVVFQQPTLFPHLSVESNLLYGYKRCLPEQRTIDFATLVDVLNLDGLLERGVNNLSGGEKQRVSLGRAVLANPRLLLMDEPMSALDDNLKFQIIPYLKIVSEQFKIPYLFISHSLVEMRLMAEQVIVVSGGRNAALTTADQLARVRMGNSPVGYINLLKVKTPRRVGGLFAYNWGNRELFISAGDDQAQALFELSSKDIILCKRHPEAISARNLIACTVANTFVSGNRIGVELACGDQL